MSRDNQNSDIYSENPMYTSLNLLSAFTVQLPKLDQNGTLLFYPFPKSICKQAINELLNPGINTNASTVFSGYRKRSVA